MPAWKGSSEWRRKVALGVEISEDRRHTSIVGAGYVSADIILVDLLACLTGTEATATVLRLGKTRTVHGGDRPALGGRHTDQAADGCRS